MKVRELFEAADNKDLISLIKKHCPNNFKALVSGAAAPLYRGADIYTTQENRDFVYSFIPPNKTARISKTGINILLHYTAFADGWSHLPERQYSTFATTDISVAKEFKSSYESLWLVIPSDNVDNFAYSPNDFNSYEHLGMKYIYDIYADAKRMLGLLIEIGFKSNQTKEEELRKSFPEIMAIAKSGQPKRIYQTDKLKFDKEFFEGINYILERLEKIEKTTNTEIPNIIEQLFESARRLRQIIKGNDLLGYMDKTINPEQMQIGSAKNYTDIPKTKFDEVWFEGGYLALRFEFGDYDLTQFKTNPAIKSLLQQM